MCTAVPCKKASNSMFHRAKKSCLVWNENEIIPSCDIRNLIIAHACALYFQKWMSEGNKFCQDCSELKIRTDCSEFSSVGDLSWEFVIPDTFACLPGCLAVPCRCLNYSLLSSSVSTVYNTALKLSLESGDLKKRWVVVTGVSIG